MTETYLCMARGCNERIHPKWHFCGVHWAMLDKPLRLALWRAYRPGQDADTSLITPEYLRAAREAVNTLCIAQPYPALNPEDNPLRPLSLLVAKEQLNP